MLQLYECPFAIHQRIMAILPIQLLNMNDPAIQITLSEDVVDARSLLLKHRNAPSLEILPTRKLRGRHT